MAEVKAMARLRRSCDKPGAPEVLVYVVAPRGVVRGARDLVVVARSEEPFHAPAHPYSLALQP